MPFKFIPAIQKLNRKHELVPVGSDEIKFYLLKRYCRTVGERELLDAAQKNHNDGQFLLVRLGDKISKDKKIPFDKALEYVFKPSPEKSEFADDAAHLEAIRDFNPMLEYPDEMKELNGLKTITNKTQFVTTTILMQTRVAFPIQLAHNAEAGATSVTLASLPFVIADKSSFKSEGAILKVVGSYQPSEEEITIQVESLHQNLAAERTLFLVDFETGKTKIGCSEWTTEDTAALPERVAEAFWAFYQREEAELDEPKADGVVEDTEKNESPTPMNSLPPLSEPVEPSLPTGSDSTLDVSPIE